MKRALGIALFFIFIIPYLGLFSWLQYQRKLVRKEVKRAIVAGLKKDELVLLKFSNSEVHTKLEWEHSKEFKYNNEMYDVVSTVSTSDSVFYYCWWDNEETVLSKKLDTLLAQLLGKNLQKKEKCKSLVSFLKSLYYEEYSDYQLRVLSNHLSFKDSNQAYLSPYISISGPPPKN